MSMTTQAEALHAEWTKLRTVAGTAWLLLAVVVLTVAVSAAATAAVSCPASGCGHDVARIGLAGVRLGQVAVVLLAVLAISGEYDTGMIRVSVAAVPRRSTLIAAKAAVVSGLVLVAGTVAVLGSVLAGRVLSSGEGTLPGLSPADGPTLRAVAGSVAYLALIGLLSLGVATATRDSATAVGAVLGLLFLFPVVAAVVTDPDWDRRLEQVAPMTAGLAVQATVDLDSLAVGPWTGLGVLAGWAAAGMGLGWLSLRLRDA